MGKGRGKGFVTTKSAFGTSSANPRDVMGPMAMTQHESHLYIGLLLELTEPF